MMKTSLERKRERAGLYFVLPSMTILPYSYLFR